MRAVGGVPPSLAASTRRNSPPFKDQCIYQPLFRALPLYVDLQIGLTTCCWRYCSKDRLDIAGVDSLPVVSTLEFESPELCDEWMKSIQRNIAAQNALSVSASTCLLYSYLFKRTLTKRKVNTI